MTIAIRFAHLSDWHATTLAGGGLGLLRPKRISGWLSWRLSRRYRHDPEILEAAIRDVRAQAVDQILVSGDLTHVSLESEFRAAALQLASLGSADRVHLIPGNHDCYVEIAAERSWNHWAPYLRSGEPGLLAPDLAACLKSGGPGLHAPTLEDYPTLWIHDRLAVIGLCSAIPTPIFRAGGRIGEAQLSRLESLLARLREHGLARVVMLHHPITATDESARRALWDAEALRAVLAREGAELVLHGHKHRRRVHFVPGPLGEIPVIGVRSSSEVGSRPDKRAEYHLYTLRSSGSGGGFRIEAEIRGFDPATRTFVQVAESVGVEALPR